ncbi:hypothetical protein F4678DRAFT_415583 [Xylaria arbuscula]|nr:hypothetical protein F4678DRAFT_415583 [Xylaria arbuscula]
MLSVQSKPETSSRIFIACSRCKTRKRKCDGATPKCSNCAAHDAECEYAAVRKTRGPGKRNKGSEIVESNLEDVFPFTRSLESEEQVALVTSRPLPVDMTNLGSVSLNSSPGHLGVKSHFPLFPNFLLQGVFDKNLAVYKSQLNEAAAVGGFYPLMPVQISRDLIGNTFADIMEEHQFISLANFTILLEAQYAASVVGPAEDSARWALVNAVIAVAMRSKIAPGAESELSPVTESFYRNATMVVDQLILLDPTLLSIQALLAMAIFCRGRPNAQAFVMLATNASHQLGIFGQKRFAGGSMFPVGDEDEFRQVYEVSNKLSQEASLVMIL